MSYEVTARKWRPQKFAEVVGQEHITTTLKNAIKDGRIAHAYLFAGPRGVGKTTTARILAKTLNCLNPDIYEPCNECENCKAIQSGQMMDIFEIDAASNRGIDEVRTLRESVKYPPTKGKYKVYIIDEVHMLTKESFNAFLKTLEEPPSQTIFIFATTDVHKVPLTIISRCQRFDFRRIEMDIIKSLLRKIAKSEKIDIDDKTLTLIARKADGALRDAESYFDQVVSFCGNEVDSTTVSKILNLVDDEVYFLISDAVLKKNFKSVFEASDLVYKNGWNFTDFMDGLIEHFRNIMTVIITENTQSIESAEVFKTRYLDYFGKFSESDILRLLNHLNKTGQDLRYSQNQKLKIEIALCHLVGLEKTSTISELIENLNSELPASKEKAEKKNYQVNPDSKFFDKNRVVSYKDPLKEPEQTYSVTEPAGDFDSIVKKWKGFADLVSEEKKFTLGHFFAASHPVDFSGNKISLQFNNNEEIKSFNINLDYLTKKAHEYFGKKLQFSAVEGNDFKHSKKEPSKNKITIQTGETINTGDQYVDLIINELGGEELS
ncbi:MAG: DNA polymerase III, subunit gamma and tau [Ignavibacteria bacterium RBG_16_34_14]|nr:MAG: DNA polymerase III, subunit gamma and tau [Ignavibacteria bacterium RBG_16_34_14]